MAPAEWNKVLTLRYKAQGSVSSVRYADLLLQIGAHVGQELIPQDDDSIFMLSVGGIACVCAVTVFPLADQPDVITSCQLSILSKGTAKPTDMTEADAVHGLIEACFLGPKRERPVN